MKFVHSFLKWFFVITVPLYSLLLIVVSTYLIWENWGDKEMTAVIIVIVLCAFVAWHKEGGFIGFRPSEIRAFIRNWDKLRQ